MPKESKSRYALLGMINTMPMSGYDIKDMCDRSISYFWHENYGNIYTVLRKMETEGLVTMERHQQDGRPEKKVYTITTAGQEALKAWLHRSPEPRRLREELLLQVFHGSMIGPEALIQKIKQQRKYCQEAIMNLSETKEYLETEIDGKDSLVPYWMQTLSFGKKFYKAEMAWCDEAIQEFTKLAESVKDEKSGNHS